MTRIGHSNPFFFTVLKSASYLSCSLVRYITMLPVNKLSAYHCACTCTDHSASEQTLAPTMTYITLVVESITFYVHCMPNKSQHFTSFLFVYRCPTCTCICACNCTCLFNLSIQQVVLCGAFYPNYFRWSSMDEELNQRTMSGHDPTTTVMVS